MDLKNMVLNRKNKFIDIENKLMLARGEGEEGMGRKDEEG